MTTLRIDPDRHRQLSSKLTPPPSKSHTLRALVFALMGSGLSHIENFLSSPDTEAMIRAIELLGARVERTPKMLKVRGTGGRLAAPENIIDAGNSGQVLRFIGALAALIPSYAVFTGDDSVRSRRPVAPLLSALRQLGVTAHPMGANGHAPFIIKGPMQPGSAFFCGRDSQPVSAMLIATAFLPSPSRLIIEEPGELPWIGLTLQWLQKLGGAVTHRNFMEYEVAGGLQYSDFAVSIPGDFSSAAYPIAAALLHQRDALFDGLDRQDAQGDKQIIELLQTMGGNLNWEDSQLNVQKTASLDGAFVDVDPIIDALPILATVGCYADGATHLLRASSARHKESDRLSAMTRELSKMGAHIEEHPSSLVLYQTSLRGADLDSHGDHRVAMALAVAAFGAKGPSQIANCGCIAKSYPSFVDDMQAMGFCVEVVP